MRETVAAYEARTGRRYDPPGDVRALGRPLAAIESCPTLFRYAGACGVRDAFERRLFYLGPPSADFVLATDVIAHSDAVGAVHFGTFALPRPLALGPVRMTVPLVDPPKAGGRDVAVWIAANVAVGPDDWAWVPPSLVSEDVDWERTDVLADVARAAGREQADVRRSLEAYFEEIAAMAATGVAGPKVPWVQLPEDVRLRWLADAGVRPRWSGVARYRREAA